MAAREGRGSHNSTFSFTRDDQFVPGAVGAPARVWIGSLAEAVEGKGTEWRVSGKPVSIDSGMRSKRWLSSFGSQ
jgi:hypothetical protein